MLAFTQTTCRVTDLGLIDYDQAYRLQQQAVETVMADGIDRLFLCEHPPVFTLGRLAREDHFLAGQDFLKEKGFQIRHIDRGGEVTLHAPGQLVAYPVLDLKKRGRDLKRYLYRLEQVAIDFLKGFDIMSERIEGKTGAWVGPTKIASVGIGVKKWISFHGLAVNVNTDLELFSYIRPCGLDVAMTSLREIKQQNIDRGQAKQIFLSVFADQLEVRLEECEML